MNLPLILLDAASPIIPAGVVDALIGLCSLGISALFGFTFAIQRRLTKIETEMEESKHDRTDIWGAVNSNRNKCDLHLIERTEVKTILQYMKSAVDEIKRDLKELKENGNHKSEK